MEEDQIVTNDDIYDEGDSDGKSSLVRQVTKLLKERQKIFRHHKRAEKKVWDIIQAKEHNGEMMYKDTPTLEPTAKVPQSRSYSLPDGQVTPKVLDNLERRLSFVETSRSQSPREQLFTQTPSQEDPEELDKSYWTKELTKAKNELDFEDKLAEEEELKYRISLEEIKSKTNNAEIGADEAKQDFLKYVNFLSKKFSRRESTESEKCLKENLEKFIEARVKLRNSRAELFNLEQKMQDSNDTLTKQRFQKGNDATMRDLINLQMEQEAIQEELRLKQLDTESTSSRLATVEERKDKMKRREDNLENKLKITRQKLMLLKEEKSETSANLEESRTHLRHLKARNSKLPEKYHLFADDSFMEDIRIKCFKNDQ